MELVRGKNTLGALERLRLRALEFGAGEYVCGPVVTPAGNDNSDLALRFGTFKSKILPRVFRLGFGWHLAFGNVKEYCQMSDWEFASLVLGPVAVMKRFR